MWLIVNIISFHVTDCQDQLLSCDGLSTSTPFMWLIVRISYLQYMWLCFRISSLPMTVCPDLLPTWDGVSGSAPYLWLCVRICSLPVTVCQDLLPTCDCVSGSAPYLWRCVRICSLPVTVCQDLLQPWWAAGECPGSQPGWLERWRSPRWFSCKKEVQCHRAKHIRQYQVWDTSLCHTYT